MQPPIPVHLAGAAAAVRSLIHAVPLGSREIRERIDVRTAAALRLLEQRLVMLLRGFEAIGADDRFARIADLAVSPRGFCVRAVIQLRLRQNPALILRRLRAIAAEVARIAPKRLVRVEVGAREDIARQRLVVLW